MAACRCHNSQRPQAIAEQILYIVSSSDLSHCCSSVSREWQEPFAPFVCTSLENVLQDLPRLHEVCVGLLHNLFNELEDGRGQHAQPACRHRTLDADCFSLSASCYPRTSTPDQPSAISRDSSSPLFLFYAPSSIAASSHSQPKFLIKG